MKGRPPLSELDLEEVGRRSHRGRAAKHGRATPEGVQGPNVEYWQAVGSTRAGAKRSKRP